MKKTYFALVMFFMANQALAFDPSGSYTFKEKGMSGDMEVKEVGGILSLKLDTVSIEANLCEFEAKGERVKSSNKLIDAFFTIHDDDADKTEFEVKFTPKGAVIKTVKWGSPVCGRDAYYDGKWSKNKK